MQEKWQIKMRSIDPTKWYKLNWKTNKKGTSNCHLILLENLAFHLIMSISDNKQHCVLWYFLFFYMSYLLAVKLPQAHPGISSFFHFFIKEKWKQTLLQIHIECGLYKSIHNPLMTTAWRCNSYDRFCSRNK